MDMMKAEEVPPLPTRKQELEYLKFLESSIATDRWITGRPKKYMAGPWRLYYKKKFEMRNEYYKTFLKNFLISAFLFKGLIVLAASKRMYNKSGVPITRVVPTDLFTPSNENKLKYDHLRNKYTKRTFRFGLFKYSIIVGFIGGYLYTDNDYFTNDLNARPDLGQFRIMTDNVPDNERKVFDMYEKTYFGKAWNDKPDAWNKRFYYKLFPSVNYNPHSSYYLPFYDYKRGYYPAHDVSSYYSG